MNNISIKNGVVALHDVIVVGSGTAGCFTSYLLAKNGLNVALLDKGSGLSNRNGSFLSQTANHPEIIFINNITQSKIPID